MAILTPDEALKFGAAIDHLKEEPAPQAASVIVREPPRQQDVAQMVNRILLLAHQHDADSDLMVLAMADAIAMVALALDRYARRMPLADRLETLNARIRVTYAANDK